VSAAPAAPKGNLVSSIRSFVPFVSKKEPAAPAQGKVKTKVGIKHVQAWACGQVPPLRCMAPGMPGLVGGCGQVLAWAA
jgi:hypothetical protein